MLTAQQIADNLNAKKRSWASGSSGFLSATGTYNPNSALAKEYAGLPEDGSSRVDGGGWREIKRDSPPKSASEYESMVRDYAAQGFDVKAIDMDGDNFTHANFAIKPSDAPVDTSDPRDEGYTQSKTLANAKAHVGAYESAILPHLGDHITGKKDDMSGNFLEAYKLNLAAELEPRNADGSIRNSQIQEEKEAVRGGLQNGFT